MSKISLFTVTALHTFNRIMHSVRKSVFQYSNWQFMKYSIAYGLTDNVYVHEMHFTHYKEDISKLHTSLDLIIYVNN